MKALVLLLAALTLAGCAGQSTPHAGSGDLRSSPVGEGGELGSCALIELAVSQGRLDYGTGLLYKVLSVHDPASLPEEFQSDAPSKCGTPIAVEVERNWHRLSPGQRAEIELYIEPLRDQDETGTDLDDIGPDRPEHGRGGVD